MPNSPPRHTSPAPAAGRAAPWAIIGAAGITAALALGVWFFKDGLFSLATRPAPENALAGQDSLYLRAAAHQPVRWLPWGEEAFERARAEDKPILLDIGASWCHGCRVMAEESYNNRTIARLINEGFVPVKVDRDERPDIDRRYQEVVRVLTGGGGWPLTVFLTPDGMAYFGGTYLPPEDRGDQPGMKTVLGRMAEAYRLQKVDVLSASAQVAALLDRLAEDSADPGPLSDQTVTLIATNILGLYDEAHGGLGGGPKFPSPGLVEFALMRHVEADDAEMLSIALRTLEAMARGGIHDQIGGGFFRSTADREWRMPRFEKMADDNAGVLVNYLHAYQATSNPEFSRVARGIMRYLDRTLSDREQGGFFAHQDAGSATDQNAGYYTWSPREVRRALPRDQAEVILLYYGITKEGNTGDSSGRNVPFIASTPEAVAQELDLSVQEVRRRIEEGRAGMAEARRKRGSPFVDTTLYTDRNGMLISAYLEAYKALGDEEAKAFALKTLERMLREAHRKGKGMAHASFEGRARVYGLLNDQLWMVAAALDAFEVTAEMRYLKTAKELMRHVIARYRDPDGRGFLDRMAEAEALGELSRPVKDIRDDPGPSSNGLAAQLLNRLAYLTNDDAFGKVARETLTAFAGTAGGLAGTGATYALALHYHLNKPPQAVIIGRKDDPGTRALWESALSAYRPGKLVAAYDPAEVRIESIPPSVAGAVKVFGQDGSPKAYVCAGATCAPPTGDPDETADLVKNYGIETE